MVQQLQFEHNMVFRLETQILETGHPHMFSWLRNVSTIHICICNEDFIILLLFQRNIVNIIIQQMN